MKSIELTGDRLGDDRWVVVRMVTRVEEVVVKGSVQPIVEELNRPRMEKKHYDQAVGPPPRQTRSARDYRYSEIQ